MVEHASARGRAPERLAAAGRLATALGLGTLGGALFTVLALPLPWLLGSLACTTAASLAGVRFALPDGLRRTMIGVLGVMLGSTFTPERIGGALAWLPTLAALPAYILVVGVVIFAYMRLCSGLDRISVFFAAVPGGLSEMIALSEQMGGDVRSVSLVHGTRLTFIVLSIPFLAAVLGPAQDVARPQAMAAPLVPADLALLAVLGVAGYLVAKRLHIPAAPFIGPLLGSTCAHLLGWVEAAPPYALLAIAQLVLGSAVGARFVGVPLAVIGRIMLLGAGATVLMLLITLAFGSVLHTLTGHPLSLLILAFIPGGFAEMSLIALAMGVDPAFVVSHHAIRVFLVVLIALPTFVLLRRSGWFDRPDEAD